MRRAFTLVELLVVIAVIGIIAGVGFGLFRGTDPNLALQSSQALINSLVTATRAQAAVTNRPARIYFYADAPPNSGTTWTPSEERFLRATFIAVQDETNPANWLKIGDDVFLTDGAFLVPGDGVITSFLNDDPNVFPPPPTWACSTSPANTTKRAAPRSQFDENARQPATINGVVTPGLLWIEILPTGRLNQAAGAGAGARRIVLTIGRWSPLEPTNPGPRYINPDVIRGLRLSTYGVPVLVNDPYGFF